ncbi:MAG: hypothetical protein V1742_03505, partial [Pseudomonadota bacterium]
LNHELAPYRRNWDTMYSALPEQQREQASAVLHEINGLLRVILQTDQEDGALLSVRQKAVEADITGVSGGQVANSAYACQSGLSRPNALTELLGLTQEAR